MSSIGEVEKVHATVFKSVHAAATPVLPARANQRWPITVRLSANFYMSAKQHTAIVVLIVVVEVSVAIVSELAAF